MFRRKNLIVCLIQYINYSLFIIMYSTREYGHEKEKTHSEREEEIENERGKELILNIRL